MLKKVLIHMSSKAAATIVFGMLFFTSSMYAKTIHVSIDGTSGNDGSSFSKGYDFKTALGKASAGDTILVQGGTHKIAQKNGTQNTITISIAGTSGKLIYIVAENGKRATFDFQWKENSKYLDSNKKISSYGFWFESSAKYLYFNRISVTRAGYQGIYVTGSTITFENCLFYNNWNSGVEVNKGGTNITLLNCDSYGNTDGKYKNGGMADGFAIKQTMGPGNKAIGCRAWDNSDDGYDTYDSDKPVKFTDCWAFNNGKNEGNGNGFKVGGLNKVQKNILKNCIAFGNTAKGFDQNHNMGGQTIYNCVSYKNGNNYGFGEKPTSGNHVFKNNIAIDGKADVQNATQSNNTWNSGFSVSTSDFESLDLSLGKIERSIDGSIPETKLFRLKKGSKLIDAGIDVGTPFVGEKPDLGPFEYNDQKTGCVMKHINLMNSPMHSKSFQNNHLFITLPSMVSTTNISVYSLNGIKVIGLSTHNKNTVSVDCASLASGAYITELTTDGVKIQLKFIK